jgi:hypothetical protein
MDPEDIKLLQAIKAMGIKPKTDTPQDFERLAIYNQSI